MPSSQPFKRHRFPAAVILCAARMYLRSPLSYQDVVDLLAERGLEVDRLLSTAGFKSSVLNCPSALRSI
jgi:transposase-like protein